MNTSKATYNWLAVVVAPVLLLAGCGDDNITANSASEFHSDRIFAVIRNMTNDDVVHVGRGTRPVFSTETDTKEILQAAFANKGRTVSLGGEHFAHMWRPDFVEAWALIEAIGLSDPDPDCEGSGISFVRCVKKQLDAGKDCTLSKEGNTYHAHCEEPE